MELNNLSMKRRSALGVIAATVAAPLLPDSAKGADKPILRVLSYNIHHGQGTDKKFDLPRIAKVISDAKPDLVALQEVDSKSKRAMGVDQAAELGRLTGLHASFGKAMDFDGGGYGVAVLSRAPITQAKTHALPITPMHEPRCALAARIKPQGLPELLFIATHLDHLRDPTDRIAQAKKLNELFAAEQDPRTPAILVGDLNATPESEPIKILLQKWTDTAPASLGGTYPSDKPKIKIDYVLLRPAAQWKVMKVEVIDEKIASDHRPMLVELQWQGM